MHGGPPVTDLPAPPVPPDCDLSGFNFMPLDCVRLVQSDLTAISTGDEFKAAVVLWCKSWANVPAGSLTDDDRVLSHAAALPMSKWKKVKAVAMHGWFKASDGMLYHPVVSQKAAEAWAHRQKQRDRARKGNEVRWGSPEDRQRIAERSQGTKKGQGQGPKDEADASSASGSASSSPEPDFLTDDPTGQPARIIPPGGSLGDLEAMHPALLVPREERAKASTVLALYGWDLCAQALTAIAAEAGPAPMGRRRRIFPDHLSAWLSARYDLGPEDYARAGITPPPKA